MNKNYPIYKTTFIDDMRSLVEEAAQNFSDSTAISYKENYWDKEVKKVTFNQWRDDVRNLGTALISKGLREETIAIVGENTYGWCCSFFGVMAIGSVTVPVDKELPIEDINGIVTTTGCKALIFGKTAESKVKELLDNDELKTVELLVSIAPESSLDAACLGGRKLVSLAQLQEKGAELYRNGDNSYYDYKIDVNKLASIVFTSGTTGKGKGVMLSQKAVLEDMTNIIPYIDFGNKTVGVLPPHHTYGSSVMLVGHAIIGCEVFISGGLRYITKELTEQKPEHLVLVPLYLETFYRKIWANIKNQGKEKLIKNMIKLSNGMCKVGIDLRKKIFSQVRAAFGGEVKMIISGGAPINPEILDFFRAMGITTLNGYGITECAPIVAANVSRNVVPGSIGNAIDCDEIKILDPNEDGEGEILVKGPNVMLGYYNDPEATAEAFTEDGFFRTGDYGKMDGDVLYITGRKKNIIVLNNGKNVYPEEIETDIQGVYGVNEVAVYAGESVSDPTKEVIVAQIYKCAVYTAHRYCIQNLIRGKHNFSVSFFVFFNIPHPPYFRHEFCKKIKNFY